MKPHPYSGITAAFATKHGKELQVAPELVHLGITLQIAPVDTDSLGTFTGEVERTGTPKEVVLRKARLGMEATGLEYGLASEGSIGPDPLIPFLSSDIECLAWVDDRLGIEIVEFYRGMDIKAARSVISEKKALVDFLQKADFPNHGLIVRSGDVIHKGINDAAKLEVIINDLSCNGKEVVIENDLRAHFSPSRQKNITAVAKQLAQRLAQLCKGCEAPGWGVVGNIYGVECRECGGLAEKAVRGKIYSCAKCELKEEALNQREFVEPAECQYCNP